MLFASDGAIHMLLWVCTAFNFDHGENSNLRHVRRRSRAETGKGVRAAVEPPSYDDALIKIDALKSRRDASHRSSPAPHLSRTWRLVARSGAGQRSEHGLSTPRLIKSRSTLRFCARTSLRLHGRNGRLSVRPPTWGLAFVNSCVLAVYDPSTSTSDGDAAAAMMQVRPRCGCARPGAGGAAHPEPASSAEPPSFFDNLYSSLRRFGRGHHDLCRDHRHRFTNKPRDGYLYRGRIETLG